MCMGCTQCSFATRRSCSILFASIFFILSSAVVVVSVDLILIGQKQREFVSKCTPQYDIDLAETPINFINSQCIKNKNESKSYMSFFSYPGCDVSATVNGKTFNAGFIYGTLEFDYFRKKLIDSLNEAQAVSNGGNEVINLNDILNNTESGVEYINYFNSNGYYYECAAGNYFEEPYLFKKSTKNLPVYVSFVGGIVVVAVFSLIAFSLLISVFSYCCCYNSSGRISRRASNPTYY